MRLIDADNLKQEIRKGTTYYVRVWDTTGRDKWEMEKDLSLKEIDEIIDNAPTIDAEPIRYGKWNIGEGMPTQCNVCGYYVKQKTYTYCPYCGARMVNDDNK